MSGCTVQRLEAPGLTFLKVSGTVDETFSATQLAQQIRADTILHLGKVTRFSSFGVREWVRLMKDLQGRVKHCILVECSPAVVNQLNMVVDFAAGAHVKSVQLPYACPDDEIDQLVVADVDSQREPLLAGRLPQVPCPRCHKPMVFDDLPGSYLAFLRDAAPAEPGSAMAAFIASFEQAAPKLEQAEAGRPSLAAAPPTPTPSQSPLPVSGSTPSAGGMTPARWGMVAAGVVAVAAAAWILKPSPPPPPIPVDPPVAKAPPGPPPLRDLSSAETMEFSTLIPSERFDEADAHLKSLESVLKRETYQSVASQIQRARANAMEQHLQKAVALTSRGRYQEAREELDTAISAGGESDRVLYQQMMLDRRMGNCPSVIQAAEALIERYPDSTRIKDANAAKKACLLPQPIQPPEMKHAMQAIQADVDGCLKSQAEGQGAIKLAWTVVPAGTTAQVKCITPSLAKSPLCQCLSEQVERLRFKPSAGPQNRRGEFVFGT